MMTAVALSKDLKCQGVSLFWGSTGLRARGDLGKLTPDYQRALAEVREDIEVLVRWQTIQDAAEEKYGNSCARFYPFMRMELEETPIVQSTEGPARIVQVMPDHLRLVMEQDVRQWKIACASADKRLPFPAPMIRMEFDQVFPPVAAPGQKYEMERLT